MWRKRNLIIASVIIVVVIAASVGFYELGLNQGRDMGYQTGFSKGSSSILIRMGSLIDLHPNNTVIITPSPVFLPNNVTLVYSFGVSSPKSPNATVDMIIYGVGASGSPQLLFNAGCRQSDSGSASLSTKNGNIELEIIFTANPNNNGTASLQFTRPLRLVSN